MCDMYIPLSHVGNCKTFEVYYIVFQKWTESYWWLISKTRNLICVLCIKRTHYKVISYDKLESEKTKQKQKSKTKQKDWIQTKTCQLEYVM
jgi:hypothetical protein